VSDSVIAVPPKLFLFDCFILCSSSSVNYMIDVVQIGYAECNIESLRCIIECSTAQRCWHHRTNGSSSSAASRGSICQRIVTTNGRTRSKVCWYRMFVISTH